MPETPRARCIISAAPASVIHRSNLKERKARSPPQTDIPMPTTAHRRKRPAGKHAPAPWVKVTAVKRVISASRSRETRARRVTMGPNPAPQRKPVNAMAPKATVEGSAAPPASAHRSRKRAHDGTGATCQCQRSRAPKNAFTLWPTAERISAAQSPIKKVSTTVGARSTASLRKSAYPPSAESPKIAAPIPHPRAKRTNERPRPSRNWARAASTHIKRRARAPARTARQPEPSRAAGSEERAEGGVTWPRDAREPHPGLRARWNSEPWLSRRRCAVHSPGEF